MGWMDRINEYLDGPKTEVVDPATATDAEKQMLARATPTEQPPAVRDPGPAFVQVNNPADDAVDPQALHDARAAELAKWQADYDRSNQVGPHQSPEDEVLRSQSGVGGSAGGPESVQGPRLRTVSDPTGITKAGPLFNAAQPAPKGPRVSVGQPASASEPLTYRPFESLAKFMPRDGASAESPSTAVAEAPKKKDDPELKRAQFMGDIERITAHGGGLIDRGVRMGMGLKPDDGIFERAEKNAGSGLRNLLQQRDEERRKLDDEGKSLENDERKVGTAAKRDFNDPNSNASKTYQKMAVARGWVKPSEAGQMTAAMFKDMQEGATWDETKRNHTLESEDRNKKMVSEEKVAAGREHSASADRAEARKFREQEAGKDRDLKRELQDEKLAAKKATARGKMDKLRQEVDSRFNNATANVDNMKKRIHDDGTTEWFGPHNAILENQKSDLAADVAKLRDPSSANRPSEIAEVKGELPETGGFFGGSQANGTAETQLDAFKESLKQRRDNFYKARLAEEARNDPDLAAELASQGLHPAAPSRGAAQTGLVPVTRNGVTRHWDPAAKAWVD